MRLEPEFYPLARESVRPCPWELRKASAYSTSSLTKTPGPGRQTWTGGSLLDPLTARCTISSFSAEVCVDGSVQEQCGHVMAPLLRFLGTQWSRQPDRFGRDHGAVLSRFHCNNVRSTESRCSLSCTPKDHHHLSNSDSLACPIHRAMENLSISERRASHTSPSLGVACATCGGAVTFCIRR